MARSTRKQWLPRLTLVVEMPEAIDPDGGKRSRVNALHNTAVKAAGKKTLIRHQVKRLPKHFEQAARSKYRYFPRAPRTREKKKRTGMPDLVKTGRTKVQITKRRPQSLRAGGNAASGRIRFSMRFSFPFKVKSRDKGVTAPLMAQEIERWTQTERDEAAIDFQLEYLSDIRARLKPRMRKRLGARLSKLGI